jgi:23S rRNA C2498 (ribose-2'-O)-methylase RlmM
MNCQKSNILVARAGYGAMLAQELAKRFGIESHPAGDDAVIVAPETRLPTYLETVFARQHLPLAECVSLADFDAGFSKIVSFFSVMVQRTNRQKGRWTLHAFALEDNEANQLASKLEKAVLGEVKTKLPKFYRRYQDPSAMASGERQSGDFVVQIYLQDPVAAWLSVGAFGSGISPYIGGNLRMRARADAPSRSARKLEEAFRVLGRMPQAGESAVDLGAAPGGWTFSLARHGAMVTAVDATDLHLPDTKTFRDRVHHVRENGLHYLPPAPVDWLCCDMVVSPYETLRVLTNWLGREWMQHFVINLKLPKSEPWTAIDQALKLMESRQWSTFKARHLFHDRFEITLLGSR